MNQSRDSHRAVALAEMRRNFRCGGGHGVTALPAYLHEIFSES